MYAKTIKGTLLQQITLISEHFYNAYVILTFLPLNSRQLSTSQFDSYSRVNIIWVW